MQAFICNHSRDHTLRSFPFISVFRFLIYYVSQVSKVMLKSLLGRMIQKLKEEISITQAGYMKNRGTRDHIYNLQSLIRKCHEMQQDLFICFVDYSKAFDNARYEKLWSVMLNMGFSPQVIKLIKSLYCEQQSAVRLECGTTEWFGIQKGVRQGCILSPALFNIYTENIMREVMDDTQVENFDLVQVNGELLGDLRYADDAALLSRTREGLNNFVQVMNARSQDYGLKMNPTKTKVMSVTDEVTDNNGIYIGQSSLEEVDNFQYLGARIERDGNNSKEIGCRLAMGLAALEGMKNLWQGQNKQTKLHLLRACVFPVATYACETWVLRKVDEKKISSFENKCYRKILKVPWTQRRTNEDIRTELSVETDWLLRYVKKQ